MLEMKEFCRCMRRKMLRHLSLCGGQLHTTNQSRLEADSHSFLRMPGIFLAPQWRKYRMEEGRLFFPVTSETHPPHFLKTPKKYEMRTTLSLKVFMEIEIMKMLK